MNKTREENWRSQELYGNTPLLESQYVGNKVSSTRYTLLTLLPKNLFEQFQRSANIWFLLVSIFQLIPFEINPVDSWTTIVPLAILIFLTLLKDSYNDYYRRKQDKITNNAEYECWSGSNFEKIKCEKILVGNVVSIYEGQKFPADIVVLGSKTERNFFLDTSGILGETDLRQKKAVSETNNLIQSIERNYVINRMAGVITYEQPSNDFNKFRGKLKLTGHPRAIELFDINLAYRGSTLHGTEWIIGIVVYTGSETKTYLNIISPPKKVSQLEKKINVWVLYLLLVLLVIVIFSMLANNYFSKNPLSKISGLEAFILFTILYNNIIPISLFVTMDIVRILQVVFIQKAFKGSVDFKIGDINENLGQVEYILTDKTGTITEKELKLQLCIIGNNKYMRNDEDSGRSHTIIDDEKPIFTKIYPETSNKLLLSSDSCRSEYNTDRPRSCFAKLKQLLVKGDNFLTLQYIKCLAICNTTNYDDGKYIGTSADEVALVEAASELGIKLLNRNKFSCEIDVLGNKEEYMILASVPFSSAIKKSRILIKKDNEYFLYVKGNLNEMLKISDETSAENIEIHDQLAGKHGLRTIIIGYKKIDENTANEFLVKYESAKHIPVNSEGRIEIIFQDLEKNSIILGLAGIEDIVLPETISTINILKKAGIKIWMLSGDNEVSTVSTARKVNLFENDVPIVSISNLKTELQCIKYLMRKISYHIFHDYSEQALSRHVSVRKPARKDSIPHAKLDSEESILPDKNFDKNIIENQDNNTNNAEIMLSQHPLFRSITKTGISISHFLNRMFFPNSVQYSLSIDRISFVTAMENDNARQLFCSLLFGASSVCFYGLLPLDKAKIVKLVKGNFKFQPVSLAIGDGNGDIPMIQAADVGIGVLSKENSQASNYSDITIKHFSLLTDLLLCHGHWNYSRMSRSVLLSIYKNALLTVIIFAYIFFSDYSGVSLFSSSLLVGFNIGFTSLPILALGVFDEDMPANKIINYPEIYSQGLNQMLFNWKRMFYVLLLSIIDGIIMPLLIGFFMTTTLNNKGYIEDQMILGTAIYIGLVFTVLIQIGLETYCFSILYILSQVLSVLVLGAYLWVASLVTLSVDDIVGVGQEIIAIPVMLIVILIVPLVILAIHQAYVQYIAVFHPSIYEKIAVSKDDEYIILKNNRLEQYSGCLAKLYRETNFIRQNLESDAFDIKKASLYFNSIFIENQYHEFYIFENIKYYKIIAVLLFSMLILWTILEAFLLTNTLYYNLIRTVMCVAFAIVVLIIWTEFFMKNYIVITIAIIAIGLIAKFGAEVAFLSPGALATGLIPAITYILFNVDWMYITYLNILSVSLYVISISIYYIYSTNIHYTFLETFLTILSYIIINISITVTSAFLGYYIERTKRLEYKLIKMEEIDIEKSQRILSFLLPAFVKKRVKDGARYIVEDKGTVTVLFCDIVDFDSICSEYSPTELTAFLDSVFQKFDQLCSAIGVTKIETVGKTYMACSGLNDFEAELDPSLKEVSHSRRAVEMGLAMISLTQTLRLKNGLLLQVKIGINTGPVTAGVVGFHKPQFSLVGDTVNTSSRMCSTIEAPNTIQISKETYDLLENYSGLIFIDNRIEAKGKGIMNTYLVCESKIIEDSSETLKPGALNHLSTFMQHSSFTRTISDTDSRKFKRRGSDLLGMVELNDSTQVFQRSDTEVIGKVKIIDFSCGESEKQKKFRIEKTKSNSQLMFIGIAISLATFSLLLLITLIEYFFTDFTVLPIVIARAAIVFLLIIIIVFHRKIFLKRFYPILMLVIFLMMQAVALLDLVYNTRKEKDLLALEIMYTLLLLNHTSEIPLSKVTWASLLVFIPWEILAAYTPNIAVHAANSAFVIVFSLINASAVYTIETHLRIYFNLRGIAEKEIDKTDKLLTQMMPPHVLENMRQDKAITDKLIGVTLLYADIVGFTAWSSNKSPKEVVGMLNEMFTRFDKVCISHQVYKVHTIGDCYVVMGYIGGDDRDMSDECYNVLRMAESMIRIIGDINTENGSELNMRIGIHTGEVIAGITGTNIVRYDIYGPDVLIANKMESGGQAGKINVSDVTMAILEKKCPEKLVFEYNKEISAKVIGRVHKSYFIKEDHSSNFLS